MTDEYKKGWGLVLAFDTDDFEFVRGMEAGIVWGALQKLDATESHEVFVHGYNAEMMVRISEATNRHIETQDTDPDWMSVKFGPVCDA